MSILKTLLPLSEAQRQAQAAALDQPTTLANAMQAPQTQQALLPPFMGNIPLPRDSQDKPGPEGKNFGDMTPDEFAKAVGDRIIGEDAFANNGIPKTWQGALAKGFTSVLPGGSLFSAVAKGALALNENDFNSAAYNNMQGPGWGSIKSQLSTPQQARAWSAFGASKEHKDWLGSSSGQRAQKAADDLISNNPDLFGVGVNRYGRSDGHSDHDRTNGSFSGGRDRDRDTAEV